MGAFIEKWFHRFLNRQKRTYLLSCFSQSFSIRPPQHLKALETSFSKLVLHIQKVHLLRELSTFNVCQWKAQRFLRSWG